MVNAMSSNKVWYNVNCREEWLRMTIVPIRNKELQFWEKCTSSDPCLRDAGLEFQKSFKNFIFMRTHVWTSVIILIIEIFLIFDCFSFTFAYIINCLL